MQASVLVARGLSSCGFQALECQLNICGEQALLLHSIWDPPGSGVKPVSPALTSLPLSHQGSPQFSRSVVSDSDPVDCSTPGFLSIANSQSLLKLLSIESVMPSNHLILCLPLLLLPSAFPSTTFSSCLQPFFSITVFSQWVSSSHQMVKILELQHQSFQWIFRIDFL